MAAGPTFTPITTYTVPSNTNTVTFSSLSQSYTHLYVVCNILSASPGAGLDYYLRINGGSSSYNSTRMGASPTGRSTTRQNQTIAFQLFYCVAGSNSGAWTSGQIWFPYYRDTTYVRNVQVQGGSNADLGRMSGFFDTTAALNQIAFSSDISFGGGNYIGAGSVFTIYGITKA